MSPHDHRGRESPEIGGLYIIPRVEAYEVDGDKWSRIPDDVNRWMTVLVTGSVVLQRADCWQLYALKEKKVLYVPDFYRLPIWYPYDEME